MIFTLIGNEIKKLMNRKKTLIITIGFALLVAFIGFGTYKDIQHRIERNKPETQIQNEMRQIKYLEEDKNNSHASEEDKKSYDEQIKEARNRIEEIKKEQKLGKPDWKVTLKTDIKNAEEELKNPDLQERDKEYIKKDMAFNQYLLQNNIKPDDRLDVKATNFLISLFEILGMAFLAIGVTVFSSDMVSGEYTPPTMKFLITQPVSRGKVLFSKFVALILSSTVIIMLIELLAFIIMGVIFKFGDMNYPIRVGTRYMYNLTAHVEAGQSALKMIASSTYIIPMWKYIINMFLLQGLFIITSASFAFLFSTIVKSSMVSMAVSIVSIISFNIFTQMPYINKIGRYLFVNYGAPNMLLDGDVALRFKNPIVTTKFGVIVLLVWAIISYVIAHVVFTKKDILI